MNDDIAIRVEGLGKRYRLGQTVDLARNFRETLMTLPRHFSRRAAEAARQAAEKLRAGRENGEPGASGDVSPQDENGWFWALRDINLEIKRGEAVGIIGRNGAGKSTLLKILSRITAPTTGRIEIRGRVAALIEVGTGMHPELTGRENIYMNGSVLGMRKGEIDRKFDEIVDFAGVEKFLDTPLKRYSSGMRVRLGFAVAAHLDPDVLIVDEVLAVGDAEFRKKCLAKMDDVTRGGRTVLFVSHNMPAVTNLCPQAILLSDGTVKSIGSSSDIVSQYINQVASADSRAGIEDALRRLPCDPTAEMKDVHIGQGDRFTLDIDNNRETEIRITYDVKEPCLGLRAYFDLVDEMGTVLIRSFHDEHATRQQTVNPGRYTSLARIPARILAPTSYFLILRLTIYNVRSCTGEGLRIPLRVFQGHRINAAYPSDPIRSKLQPMISWSTENNSQRFGHQFTKNNS